MIPAGEESEVHPPAAPRTGAAGEEPAPAGEAPTGQPPNAGNGEVAGEGGDNDAPAPDVVDDLAIRVVGDPKLSFPSVGHEDRVRSRLAFALFWLFAVTAVTGLGLNAFLDNDSAAHVNAWLEKLLPTQIGIFGSALGFYYGSRS